MFPSESERRKIGMIVFDTHADCFIAKRSNESVELMRKLVKEQKAAEVVYRDGKRVVLTT
jgi:hypothetical protein